MWPLESFRRIRFLAGIGALLFCCSGLVCFGQYKAYSAEHIKGVAFVARWAFEEPIKLIGVEELEKKHGYVVGFVVNAGTFLDYRAAPPPVIFADRTETVNAQILLFHKKPIRNKETRAVDPSKTIMVDTSFPLVVVLINDVSLTKTRFWIGQSLQGLHRSSKHLLPQVISKTFDDAEKAGQLAGPISPESLREASVVLTDEPVKSMKELRTLIMQFREKLERDEIERTIIPFEPKKLNTSPDAEPDEE